MTINELCKASEGTLLTNGDADRTVACGYTCDLLSCVMAKGRADMAWITVQTHMNVIAVATLLDMAVVVIPEGIAVPPDSIAKAEEEGIAIISSQKTAYEICALMAESGVPAPQ